MKKRLLINSILELLEKEDNFVFLDTARCDAENFLSYIFLGPRKIISTNRIDEVKNCLTDVNRFLQEGYYIAGFLSYETGETFEERLKRGKTFDFPLLWFGIYEDPLIYNHHKEKFVSFSSKARRLIKEIVSSKNYERGIYLLKNIRPNISQASYERAIAEIKDLIAQGFTYQVNYTFKLKFHFTGSPAGLYLNLRDKQSVSYSAFIKSGSKFILSFSPELFFKKKGRTVLARPMKGTAKRGKDLKEDSINAGQLRNCLKNRSENVMIVDLLRNDLGRISTTGSVTVPRLFNVERYQTLLQMTSDVKSRLRPGSCVLDMFKYIFPSGSVTGAPKIKTMEIIRKLEKESRNVYTGSIGFFSPKKSGVFNVAIRTILINTDKKTGEMGVGSGIVYDSDAKAEFAECRLKADFLTQKPKIFRLIETVLWQPKKGYLFLKPHLERLENSARYFDFSYKKENILKALKDLQKHFRQNPYKVRLLLSKDGEIGLDSSLLKSVFSDVPRVCFSLKKTCSQNPFLYHKTTLRRLYDEEFNKCRHLGFFDIIFSNEKGEITEGAISNIFIKKNRMLYTPPVNCGLLDGIYRRYLLNSKKRPIKEKILFKEDLFKADEIYLSNSVRGLVRVELEGKNH